MGTKRITLKEARKLAANRGVPEKDVLTAKDIARVVDTESLTKTAQQHSGRVLNDLLKSSRKGDTRASIEVLDRGHGKVMQGVELNVEMTIKALHQHVLGPLIAPPETIETPHRLPRVRPARV